MDAEAALDAWLAAVGLERGGSTNEWEIASARTDDDVPEGVRLRFERKGESIDVVLQATNPARPAFGRTPSLDVLHGAVKKELAADTVRLMDAILTIVRSHDRGQVPPPPRAGNRPGVDLDRGASPGVHPPSLTRSVLAIWADIEELGLVRHVAELEALGFTVVPPEKVAPPGFTDALFQAVIDVAFDRWGVRLDPNGELPLAGPVYAKERIDFRAARESPRGALLEGLLFEGPLFEQALMNTTLGALVTYLLGYECTLSAYHAWLKGQGGPEFPLHADSLWMTPSSSWADSCNAMYLLSDFTKGSGATCFVPGSHKLQRAPVGSEGYDDRVPLQAAKGSLVVWHGATWHGSFDKRTSGLRVSVPLLFSRPQFQTLEPIRGRATREMIERNPPRFRTYVGETSPWGGRTELDLPRAGAGPAKSPYGR